MPIRGAHAQGPSLKDDRVDVSLSRSLSCMRYTLARLVRPRDQGCEQFELLAASDLLSLFLLPSPSRPRPCLTAPRFAPGG